MYKGHVSLQSVCESEGPIAIFTSVFSVILMHMLHLRKIFKDMLDQHLQRLSIWRSQLTCLFMFPFMLKVALQMGHVRFSASASCLAGLDFPEEDLRTDALLALGGGLLWLRINSSRIFREEGTRSVSMLPRAIRESGLSVHVQ